MGVFTQLQRQQVGLKRRVREITSLIRACVYVCVWEKECEFVQQNFGDLGRKRQTCSSWILSADSWAELGCQGERVYIEKVPKETMTLHVCFGGFKRNGGMLVAAWGSSGVGPLQQGSGAGVAVSAVSCPDSERRPSLFFLGCLWLLWQKRL